MTQMLISWPVLGWLGNFMKPNGFPLQIGTSIAQKDPDELVDKLVSFVLHVRSLS